MNTKNTKLSSIFLTFISLIFLFSCNSDSRKVKKFLGRLNAGEINSSSKYVWPEDHNRLYVFQKRFLDNKDLLSLEYIDGNTRNEGDRTFIEAQIKCNNCDSSIINYFKTKNKFDGKYILESFEIKKAHDIEYLSLDWSWDTTHFSNNIKICQDTVREVKLREKPSSNSKIIHSIEKNSDFIIDENYDNEGWGKVLFIDSNGNIKPLYFSSRSSNIKSNISYFTLSWFGGLSILVIAIVAIICFVVIFPLLLVGLFKSGSEGGVQAGCFVFILIIIVIFVGYQFLENLLFELFLINLPL